MCVCVCVLYMCTCTQSHTRARSFNVTVVLAIIITYTCTCTCTCTRTPQGIQAHVQGRQDVGSAIHLSSLSEENIQLVWAPSHHVEPPALEKDSQLFLQVPAWEEEEVWDHWEPLSAAFRPRGWRRHCSLVTTPKGLTLKNRSVKVSI